MTLMDDRWYIIYRLFRTITSLGLIFQLKYYKYNEWPTNWMYYYFLPLPLYNDTISQYDLFFTKHEQPRVCYLNSVLNTACAIFVCRTRKIQSLWWSSSWPPPWSPLPRRVCRYFCWCENTSVSGLEFQLVSVSLN